MNQPPVLNINPVAEILASVRSSLSKAQSSFDDGILRDEPSEEYVQYWLENAFIEMRLFLETANLLNALESIKRLHSLAKKNYSKADVSPESGEPYLIWASKLRQYVHAAESIFGEPKSGTITKDVVEILRATQYSIIDPKCFDHAPRNERDVHVRIEAVLQCVFPDLINKPPITKQIKHFEPDTGLPSIRTLIEYKFITCNDEAKRVAEEVLADTRGYISQEWNQFVYVIYETKRIKPEKQWNQLFRSSDVGSNTSILVIHGEEPAKAKEIRRKAAGVRS